MNVYWETAEKSILIREFPETWTWDDYEASIRKMRFMLHQVSHKVFIIKDCRQVRVLPEGALSYFREGNRNTPSHVVMRILITQNTLLQMLISNLQKIAPQDFENYHCVATMEEARKLIEQAELG